MVFYPAGYLVSRFAGFQVGEAGEMFQVSFGGNIKLLVLVEVGIKDEGGQKERKQLRWLKRDAPVQLKMNGLQSEELQPCVSLPLKSALPWGDTAPDLIVLGNWKLFFLF